MRCLAVAVLSVLLAAPSLARAKERLLVPQPAGWIGAESHSDPTAEEGALIPAGESADNWTRRITVQAYRGVPTTVAGFLEVLGANSALICDDLAAEPPRMGMLGPLQAGSRAIACGRVKGEQRGEYALAYAIRGRDAFYVVIREWRGAPFSASQRPIDDGELSDWLRFLRGVRVCDTTDPSRPCQGNR